MKNFNAFAFKVATKKNVLISTIIFLLFLLIVLPVVAKYTEIITGSLETPDTFFFYQPEDLYRLAQIYGDTGRAAYVYLRISFDVIWPVVYGTFLILSTAYFLKESNFKDLSWILFVPILGVIFDLLENIGASIVMARYPLESPIFAYSTPYFTFFKWIILIISFFILFGVIVNHLYLKKKNKKI
ncbi:MAG: hypothetical protein KJ971_03645 [Firmicutes bacterium]|nr:hypothetical protein [Bacillota bacterium]